MLPTVVTNSYQGSQLKIFKTTELIEETPNLPKIKTAHARELNIRALQQYNSTIADHIIMQEIESLDWTINLLYHMRYVLNIEKGRNLSLKS